jgi:SAM-dependent methyltransferase
VVRLVSTGAFRGSVLDAGCGSGDNSLHLAARRLRPLGVDVAETAVCIARDRAAARRLDAEFIVADALRLDRLERRFETVLDCALFHAFDRDERRAYVASLASVTTPGAQLYLLCFSDADPAHAGPHPVSREELTEPFTRDPSWRIVSIGAELLLTRFAPDGVPAWVATIERVAPRR